jgi:hypothetical protein
MASGDASLAGDGDQAEDAEQDAVGKVYGRRSEEEEELE